MRSRQKSNRLHERSASQIRQPQRLQRNHFSLFSPAAQRTTHHFGVRIRSAMKSHAKEEKIPSPRNESVVKFVPALVSVQFCGQTAGSQRKFDEEIARRDNDENGCAGTRFHEGQAEGKENFCLHIHFRYQCMYVYVCVRSACLGARGRFFCAPSHAEIKIDANNGAVGERASAASAANHRRLN
jgi:hypothetical protein